MIRTSGQVFRRPFQGSPPVVFSHPGFRFASPWAMILAPFQGCRMLCAGLLEFHDGN
jgi:hypothetical protein